MTSGRLTSHEREKRGRRHGSWRLKCGGAQQEKAGNREMAKTAYWRWRRNSERSANPLQGCQSARVQESQTSNYLVKLWSSSNCGRIHQCLHSALDHLLVRRRATHTHCCRHTLGHCITQSTRLQQSSDWAQCKPDHRSLQGPTDRHTSLTSSTTTE